MADNPRRILPPTETGPPETESYTPFPFRTVRCSRYRHHQDCLSDRPNRKRRLAAGAWLWLAKGQGAEQR